MPVAILAVAALLPGLLAPSLDAAVFSLVGERLSQGQLPYAQLFDHKPPGMYLLIACGQLLNGTLGAWKVSWILSVVSLALTGTLVADTLRALGWRRLAWAAGGLCVAELGSFPLALGGGLGETIAVFPAAVAVRIGLLGSMRSGTLIAAGALAGIAAAISVQAAPALVALLVAVLLRHSSPSHHRALHGLRIVSGAAAVWTVLLVAMGSTGATGAAVEAVIGYNRAYTQLAAFDTPMGTEAMHAFLVVSPLAVLATVGAARSLLRRTQVEFTVVMLAWIASSVALIAVQGRLELHYVTLLVPPLALLAPAGLELLWIRGTFPRLAGSATLAAFLVAAFGVSLLLATVETAMAMEVRSGQAIRSHAVASWVWRQVPADQQIFVWGNVPEIYLDADRTPASPYVYMLPLTTPGFTSERLIGQVLADWKSAPPGVIVDAGSAAPGSAGLPPLLIQRPTLALDGRNADLLDPLRDFVRERYRLATTVQGWPIYVLR